MALLSWDDRYSVGVKRLDEQHQSLFKLVNEIHDAMLHGKSRGNLNSVLRELRKYVVVHFGDEELYMEKFNYPGIAAHKQQHAMFADKLDELNEKFEHGNLAVSTELIKFLIDWLVNHINVTDRKYTKCFNENGLT